MNFKPKQVGEYTRINKSEARKLYNEQGAPIWVLPHKMDVTNPWEPPYHLPKEGNFDKIISTYQYYNCNDKLGRYVSYYTK